MRSDQRISTWVAFYLPVSDEKRNIQQLQDYLLFALLRAAGGSCQLPKSLVAETNAPPLLSADKRIDLVSDPIIFENDGKERSNQPK